MLGKDHLFVFVEVVVDGARHFFGDGFGMHVAILTVEFVLLIILNRLLLLQSCLSFLLGSGLGLMLVGCDHYFRGILAGSAALLTHLSLLLKEQIIILAFDNY